MSYIILICALIFYVKEVHLYQINYAYNGLSTKSKIFIAGIFSKNLQNCCFIINFMANKSVNLSKVNKKLSGVRGGA